MQRCNQDGNPGGAFRVRQMRGDGPKRRIQAGAWQRRRKVAENRDRGGHSGIERGPLKEIPESG